MRHVLDLTRPLTVRLKAMDLAKARVRSEEGKIEN